MIPKTKIKSKSKITKKTKILKKIKTQSKPSFLQRNKNDITKLGFSSLLATAIVLQGFNYYKKSIRDTIHREIQFAIHSGYSKAEAIELAKQEYVKKYGSDEKTMKKFQDYVIYSFKEADKGNDPFKKFQETMDETLKKLKNPK